MDTIKVSVVIFFLSTPNNVENIQKRTLYLKKKKGKKKRERGDKQNIRRRSFPGPPQHGPPKAL